MRSVKQGICDGVRRQVDAGVEAAATAHLPLAALRLRATCASGRARSRWLDRSGSRDGFGPPRAGASSAAPVLTRRLLETACDDSAAGKAARLGTSAAHPGRRPPIEDFLEIAQRAADDLRAVTDVAERTAANGRRGVRGSGGWRRRSVSSPRRQALEGQTRRGRPRARRRPAVAP